LTEVGKGKLQGEVLSSIFKGTFHEITVLHNEKDEIVAQASGDIAKGTKVGVDILPDSIHLMHFNEKANHFTGMIDDAMRIRLVDGSIKVDTTKRVRHCRMEFFMIRAVIRSRQRDARWLSI